MRGCPRCHKSEQKEAKQGISYCPCTEEQRVRYYASRFISILPSRQEDPCRTVYPLCKSCWGKIRPEERLKYTLDLLMIWKFADDDERFRTESAIAFEVLK